MNKRAALNLIDEHKNKLVDPVELLGWTWLRVVINQIPEDRWEAYLEEAVEAMV